MTDTTVWTPMTEPVMGIELPGSLPNGCVLIGVAAKIKKLGFITINVWSSGFYIEPEAAIQHLAAYQGKSFDEISQLGPAVFDAILKGPFKRGFYCILNRNLTASQVSGGFREFLAPLVPTEVDSFCNAITDILEGQVISQMVEADGTFKFTYAGTEHTFSPAVGNTILELGIGKSNTDDPAKKNRMLLRLPGLWPPAGDDEDAPGSSSSSSITKQGTLMKFQPLAQGIIKATWAPREMSLNGTIFGYRKKGEKREKKWDLRNCLITDGGEKLGRARMNEKSTMHFIFCVKNFKENKEWKFSSENSEEIDNWLWLLQEAKPRAARAAAQTPASAAKTSELADVGVRQRRPPDASQTVTAAATARDTKMASTGNPHLDKALAFAATLPPPAVFASLCLNLLLSLIVLILRKLC